MQGAMNLLNPEDLPIDEPSDGPADLFHRADEQISAIEYLLKSTEENESDILQADRLHNLSVALHSRFRRTGAIDDLERSIEINRHAVMLTPSSHPDLAAYLTSLASVLLSAFERTGDLADLDQAIRVAEQAVASTPIDDPNRAGRLKNLGAALHSRFKRTGVMDDLQGSISAIEVAVDTTPNDHPDRTMFLNLLGKALHSRFERTGSTDDLDRAIRCNEEALAVAFAPPSLRIQAANFASQLLGKDFRRSQPLLRSAVELLSTISPRQLKLSDQQHNISPFVGLTARAVSVSLECNDDPYDALKLFELGRGVLAGLRLDLRYDVSDLAASHPDLAMQFNDICIKLDQSWSDGVGPTQLGKYTYPEYRHYLSRDFDSLLNKIRGISQYEQFLRGPSKNELKMLAARGLIVALNVSKTRTDAFLVDTNGIRVLPLSELKYQDLENMTNKFLDAVFSAYRSRTHQKAGSELSRILEWLWDVAVDPILNALGITGPPADDSTWPRIWWVASGLLNLLPIHAAGYHNADRSRSLIDRAISSYTPTLKALMHAEERAVIADLVLRQKALLVGMPRTANHPDLPFVDMEVERLRELLSAGISTTVLKGPTKSQVLDMLKEHQIVHFSCHGYSSSDPSQSKILFSDWETSPLTVADLTTLNLPSPQFGFLSACHTASTRNLELLDESINLSSAMQLAGYPSVVGTLWQVNDEQMAELSQKVYRRMWDGTKLDTRRSAEALHFAMRSLRDEMRNISGFPRRFAPDPLVWAPYVHIGV